MPKALLLVHGYSVRSFDTYGFLPSLLQADKFASEDIWLSAYDSLNDDITCEDLARALEIRVSALEGAGLKINETGVIAHSTGAIVVRRWLLNRWKAGAVVPSHFVSLAGANNGSTRAQLAQTQLAHIFRALAEGSSVGLEVLQDLDYGSECLLKLNEDWLDAYLSPIPPTKMAFSLIGDEHIALIDQLAWQTHENGSDSTVRVSGGNLNYRLTTYDQTARPVLTMKQLPFVVPHLVIHGISHTGDHGIIDGSAVSMEMVYPRIKEALGISTANDYAGLSKSWDSLTSQWNAAYPDQCDSTIVFSLKHSCGRNAKNSLILIKDQRGNG